MPIELFIAVLMLAFGLYLYTYPEGALIILGIKCEKGCSSEQPEKYVFCGIRVPSNVALITVKCFGFVISLIAMSIAVVSSLMDNGELLRILHLI